MKTFKNVEKVAIVAQMETGEPKDMSNRHILIVECEKGLQRILALTLKRESFLVSVAGSCGEASEMVADLGHKGSPVDLVLIDLNSMGDNCDGLAGKLSRADDNLQLVVLVGYGEEEEITQQFQEKCVLLINKPVEAKELIAGINKVMLNRT